VSFAEFEYTFGTKRVLKFEHFATEEPHMVQHPDLLLVDAGVVRLYFPYMFLYGA
jgi:hypothetical protein